MFLFIIYMKLVFIDLCKRLNNNFNSDFSFKEAEKITIKIFWYAKVIVLIDYYLFQSCIIPKEYYAKIL